MMIATVLLHSSVRKSDFLTVIPSFLVLVFFIDPYFVKKFINFFNILISVFKL